MQKTFFSILLKFSLLSAAIMVCTILSTQGQSRITVTGRVIDSKGDPVPATITVKETKKNIAANSDGNFSIDNVVAGMHLLISGVSIETLEMTINSNPTLGDIIVQTKIKEGENVIVEGNTGYQKIKPNETNGAVVVIDNKTLNQQTGTNILKRLEGVTPGLLFDNNKLINGIVRNDVISVRGLSTINASTAVLIVLDGFIYEGDINNINPNDIENITVLKDAAATSIWGARAGNGVIVISTKKGRFNQKPIVTINAVTLFNQKPDLFYLPHTSSPDYINLEQFLFNQGYFDGIASDPTIALTPAVDVFLSRRNGTLSAADSMARIDALKKIDTREQFDKYVYRHAVTQQYGIGVRGGSAANSYSFAMNYDKKAGESKDAFQKVNIKLDNAFKPFKNLQLNIGLYYTNSKSVSGIPDYNSYSMEVNGKPAPYLQLADNNGNPVALANTYRTAYTDTAGGGKLFDWKYYPLEDYKHDKTTTTQQEIFGVAGLQYRVADFLDVEANYQYQQQLNVVDHLSDAQSFAARSIVNLYSQQDPGNGNVTYIVPPGGIRNLINTTTSSQTARGQINFHQIVGDHALSAIAGAEIREAAANRSNFTSYGYNADPLTYGVVDFVNYYPMFTNGYYGNIYGAPSFGSTSNRFVSMYANGSYTYKKKYSLSASARRDGSNVFGLATNDKWKPLWSVGAGWKISDEPFFKSILLQLLKLRATYGVSGNVDLSKTAEATGGYQGNAPITNLPFVGIDVLNNPDLRWEKSAMLNVGIDFSFENNVLSGSIDYYQKHNKDLYGQTPYDYTAWGSSPTITKNVASTVGKGIDIFLTSKNIDRQLKWNTTLILNYNTDKTIKYEGPAAKSIQSIIGSGQLIIPEIGKPLYAIAAYKWGGLDNAGDPQGYVNGAKSTDYDAIYNEGRLKGMDGNIVYLGRSTPPIFGSLTNTISWKGLACSFMINYKFGYYFQKSSISYSSLIDYGFGNNEYETRWQKAGDETLTNVPAFVYPNNQSRDNFYQQSSVNILKADHIRLQYINLSYQIPRLPWKSLAASIIELYANASNLGILWRANNQGLDPEYPAALRLERTFALGVRASF